MTTQNINFIVRVPIYEEGPTVALQCGAVITIPDTPVPFASEVFAKLADSATCALRDAIKAKVNPKMQEFLSILSTASRVHAEYGDAYARDWMLSVLDPTRQEGAPVEAAPQSDLERTPSADDEQSSQIPVVGPHDQEAA